MQVLFDNLAATIAAAMIFLMLVAINQRNQRIAIEATSYEALRKQQTNFIKHILRRDMAGVTQVQDLQEQADGTFTFYTRHRDDTTEIRVTYAIEPTGTLDDGTNIFRIDRLVKKPAQAETQNGGSAATITDWTIEARNADGSVPSDPADVRQLFVRFELASPFSTEGVGRRYWKATYRPVQLQRNQVL